MGEPGERKRVLRLSSRSNFRWVCLRPSGVLHHAASERIRPTIWSALVLHEGDDLAFDILAVAPLDPGADLTVVIQT
jgi:hypothetical protein